MLNMKITRRKEKQEKRKGNGYGGEATYHYFVDFPHLSSNSSVITLYFAIYMLESKREYNTKNKNKEYQEIELEGEVVELVILVGYCPVKENLDYMY